MGGGGGGPRFNFQAGGNPFDAFFQQQQQRTQQRRPNRSEEKEEEAGSFDFTGLLPLLIFGLPVLLPLLKSLGSFVLIPAMMLVPSQYRQKVFLAYLFMTMFGFI